MTLIFAPFGSVLVFYTFVAGKPPAEWGDGQPWNNALRGGATLDRCGMHSAVALVVRYRGMHSAVALHGSVP
jgi:hypothetical protein